ncbi:hypothetical protein BD626DRAFT_478726 [Schizophyllum amplum]|uniref:Uncharacterized protein n=1 Tax=Schizophyllum amplum TaxID=97359 RepID=A0A550CRJ1_9AGAR|nr:hypothetical protein BD626DRAFT_478726 [Auriculariopsis ampla]
MSEDLALSASAGAICNFLACMPPTDLPPQPFPESVHGPHASTLLLDSDIQKRAQAGRLAVSLAASVFSAKRLPKGWEGAIQHAVDIYTDERVLKSLASVYRFISSAAFLVSINDVLECHGDRGRRLVEGWLMEIYARFPIINIPSSFHTQQIDVSFLSGNWSALDTARHTLETYLNAEFLASTPRTSSALSTLRAESYFHIPTDSVTSPDILASVVSHLVIILRPVSLLAYRPLGPLERGHLLACKRSTRVLECQGDLILRVSLWPVLLYRLPHASHEELAALLDSITSDLALAWAFPDGGQQAREDDPTPKARTVRAYIGQYWRMRGLRVARDLCRRVWMALLDAVLNVIGPELARQAVYFVGDCAAADATLVDEVDAEAVKGDASARRKERAPHAGKKRGGRGRREKRALISNDGRRVKENAIIVSKSIAEAKTRLQMRTTMAPSNEPQSVEHRILRELLGSRRM